MGSSIASNFRVICLNFSLHFCPFLTFEKWSSLKKWSQNIKKIQKRFVKENPKKILIYSICYRCPAKCKTSADGSSIKFVNLNHNHGVNTGTRNGSNVERPPKVLTPPIKNEQNWIDYWLILVYFECGTNWIWKKTNTVISQSL